MADRPAVPGQNVLFDFYGVVCEIISPAPEIIEEFRRDFSLFQKSSGSPHIVLQLFLEKIPPGPFPSTDGKAGVHIEDDGPVRKVIYDGTAAVVHDFSSEHGKVYALNVDLLHELAYLLLLSRVGEYLDRQGLHRVHGLGFELKGRTVLVLLPIGGGKTTLAMELLKVDSFRLLSEDTPLVDREGCLWPFPVRLGIVADRPVPEVPAHFQRIFRRREWGTKVLVDVEFAGEHWSSREEARRPEIILVGEKGFGAEPRAERKARGWAAPALLWNLVIGVGVPQGREFLLRPRAAAVLALVRSAASRTVSLVRLLRRCRVYRLSLSGRPEENARFILENVSAW